MIYIVQSPKKKQKPTLPPRVSGMEDGSFSANRKAGTVIYI